MKARLCALAVCFCVAFVSAPFAARATPVSSSQETDFQSWDELDLLTRLSPYLDVTWIGRGRFSTDLPNPAVYLFGTDWYFSASKYLEITPSFYYFAVRTASSGAWTRNRIVGGGHKAFAERIAGDLYYQRENNWNSKPAHINTIAVLLELRIR
jgi:hypothetical protein